MPPTMPDFVRRASAFMEPPPIPPPASRAREAAVPVPRRREPEPEDVAAAARVTAAGNEDAWNEDPVYAARVTAKKMMQRSKEHKHARVIGMDVDDLTQTLLEGMAAIHHTVRFKENFGPRTHFDEFARTEFFCLDCHTCTPSYECACLHASSKNHGRRPLPPVADRALQRIRAAQQMA